MSLAAILAVVLLAVVSVFQIALAMGAPLGYAAWGGRYGGVLPGKLRVASGVAGMVVYPVIGFYVLASAGLITADSMPGTGKTGMWILSGFFTLGALANFASRSRRERFWGPVSLAVAVCCGIIAARIQLTMSVLDAAMPEWHWCATYGIWLPVSPAEALEVMKSIPPPKINRMKG